MSSLNVVMVLFGSPDSNSGYHAGGMAARLAPLDIECVLAVPGKQSRSDGHSGIRHVPFDAFLKGLVEFTNGNGPDIIHAWTPREAVRRFCEEMVERHPKSKVIVHLEDNECHLTEVDTGLTWAKLKKYPLQELDAVIAPNRYHPIHGPAWLSRADGFTMVIQSLDRFIESSAPSMLLPPIADECLYFPRPLNIDLRRRLGIPDNHIVLTYPGNVHAANKDDVRMLHVAVEQLNKQGCPATLIRTGRVSEHIEDNNWSYAHTMQLNWVNRRHLPEILAAANFFVQPGKTGEFNDFRLPSKLPECFAIGRPVILPRTNIGRYLRDEYDACVLDYADSDAIAQSVLRLAADSALCERLALGAAAFSRIHWDPFRLAKSLHDFYYRVANISVDKSNSD